MSCCKHSNCGVKEINSLFLQARLKLCILHVVPSLVQCAKSSSARIPLNSYKNQSALEYSSVTDAAGNFRSKQYVKNSCAKFVFLDMKRVCQLKSLKKGEGL